MSNRNYFCLCDDNCKFPTMTREQILTAIMEAVEQGEIHDVDAGFITTIVEQNAESPLKFWRGTRAEYNALSEIDPQCHYIITDDTASLEALQEAIEELDSSTTEQFGAVAAEIADINEQLDDCVTDTELAGKLVVNEASGYIGRGIYLSSSEPTGAIPEGLIWAVYE